MSTHGSIVLLLVAAGLLAAPAHRAAGAGEDAAAQASLVKRIRVLGADGKPLQAGEVEIFQSETFVTRSKIDKDGYFELDHAKLEGGDAYRVSVLDANLAEVYAMDGWVYNSDDFDAVLDPAVGVNKYDLAISLQGAQNASMSLAVDRRVNEDWKRAVSPAETVAATDEGGVDLPKYVANASVVFVSGNFGADEDALAGIPEADPGFSLSLGFRYGYPALTDANTWAKYREVTVAYAQNRYTTNNAHNTEQSDVAYHRGTVAYGIGRMKAKHDMSVALAIDVGGIYDGSEKLEFGEREYGLFGFGVRGRYIFRLASHLGLSGDIDLMYYPADSQDDDHWYGLAPSIAIGAAVY